MFRWESKIFLSLILLQSHHDGVALRPVAGIIHCNDLVFQGFAAWLVGQDNGFGGDAIRQRPVPVRQFPSNPQIGKWKADGIKWRDADRIIVFQRGNQ